MGLAGRDLTRLAPVAGAHRPAGERVAEGGHRVDPVDGAVVGGLLLGGEHELLGVVAGGGPCLVQQRGVRGRFEIEQSVDAGRGDDQAAAFPVPGERVPGLVSGTP